MLAKIRRIGIYITSLSLTFTFVAPISHAATLFFSPSSGNYNVDQTISVSLLTSSEDQSMNAVSATIGYSTDTLEVSSISTTNSIINYWLQQPTDTNGSISLEGVVLNPGFTGANGEVARISFRSKQEGTGSISFSSGSLLANDGQGTNITDWLGNAEFTFRTPTPIPTRAATPTPTPNPTPTHTPTPTPQETPQPTQPQSTVEPTPKHSQTPSPTPTQTIEEKLEEIKHPVTKQIIQNIGSVPIVGKQLQEVSTDVAKLAQDSNVSTVTLVTTTLVVTAPSVATVATGTAATINYLSLWHLPAFLTGLFRKKKKPWGVVYDAVTKEPLDPVIITLTNQTTKEEYSTISDLYGRYEFIVDPGEYELTAKKTNYAFPAEQTDKKDTDGIYDHLYYGGVINVREGEKIDYNIPMDPLQPDWNQWEKRRLGLFTKKNFINLSNYIFYIGLIWSVVAYILAPQTGNLLILFLFIGLFLFRIYQSRSRTWGVIKNYHGKPVAGAVVKLINEHVPNLNYPPVITKASGRYDFLVDEGEYRVKVLERTNNNVLHEIYETKPIEIHKEYGHVGQDIKLPRIELTANQSSQSEILNSLDSPESAVMHIHEKFTLTQKHYQLLLIFYVFLFLAMVGLFAMQAITIKLLLEILGR